MISLSILQLSISATILILAIAIIRVLTINIAPKRTFLALWGVAVLRLFVPVSITSPFSIFSFFTPRNFSNNVGATLFSEPLAPNVTESPSVNVNQIPAEANMLPPFHMLLIVGTVLITLFFIIGYVSNMRKFKASLPIDNEYVSHWLHENKLIRPVQIRSSDEISTPLTYGVLRPVVLLTKHIDWENEKQLQYVLTHEFIHIKRFDAVLKLLFTGALCLHWFNPAVWLMYILANRDIELSCDEAVVRKSGLENKSSYALMLISMVGNQNRRPIIPLHNNFNKYAIEGRVKAIIKIKSKSLLGIFIAIAVVLGTMTVFATSASSKNIAPNGIRGIDVSSFQGNVDWVKASKDDVNFAIVRATMGLTTDEKFYTNIKGASENNLPVGAWHYAAFSDRSSMLMEAEYFAKTLEGGDLSYPIFLDIEEDNGLSKHDLTELCVEFMETMKEKGYNIMLYSHSNFIRDHLDTSLLAGYGLWVANYKEEPALGQKIWQYTSMGSVKGIEGMVDINIANADYSLNKQDTQ